MGGDGQALANNRGLIHRSRLYEKQVDPDDTANQETQTAKERRVERWTHCALSLDPLENPVAFDLGGNIFSKISVVEHLMSRKAAADPDAPDTDNFELRKLADVKEISNDTNPENPTICCAVTRVSTASGQHLFKGFWNCGHIIVNSEVEMSKGNPEAECPRCGVTSCVATMCPDTAAESAAQRKSLRARIRSKKKRAREDEGEKLDAG